MILRNGILVFLPESCASGNPGELSSGLARCNCGPTDIGRVRRSVSGARDVRASDSSAGTAAAALATTRSDLAMATASDTPTRQRNRPPTPCLSTS